MPVQFFRITLQPEQKELLLAFLTDLPFSGFEETPDGWLAYPDRGADLEDLQVRLEEIRARIPFTLDQEEIADRNWNASWEAHFSPVWIEDFCWVRAPFHPERSDVPFQLTIQPKMAFGTGHHETTYMMMAMMRELDWAGRSVLDFGCGTGILAILAAKMGADPVEGVDISPEACRNARENASLNQVSISVAEGGLEKARRQFYDRILANITRNVILAHLEALYKRISPNGIVLFSGLLTEDEEQVRDRLQKAGFGIQSQMRRGKWTCLQVFKA